MIESIELSTVLGSVSTGSVWNQIHFQVFLNTDHIYWQPGAVSSQPLLTMLRMGIPPLLDFDCWTGAPHDPNPDKR